MLFVPQAQPSSPERAIWVDLACKSLFKQSLVKHSKSESHISAVQMEADLCSSKRDGGITMALQ